MIVDVDHFKAFNDTYGHQQGDECLRQVAGALSSALHRASDFVGRYGGEEFVVLLPATPAEHALLVAEELRQRTAALALEHRSSSVAKVVTVSIGVATTKPGPGESPEAFFVAADEALYRAKSQGRNRVSP